MTEPVNQAYAPELLSTAAAPFRRPLLGMQPEYLHPPYVSSILRAPRHPPIRLPHTITEASGLVFAPDFARPGAADLTRQHDAAPIGERIIVSGRVLDEDGRPERNTLIEIWQANACGRYLHHRDRHDAPLDPNFSGRGQVMTDDEGRYRFLTIKPGSYPWRNHHNAWRPAHIHLSLLGPAFATRLVTQMYFPGDPLLPFDPIYNCTADAEARTHLISRFDWDNVQPEYALAFRFDIVLRGREATPLEG